VVGEQDRPGEPVGGIEVAFDQADEHVRLCACRDALHEVSELLCSWACAASTPSDDWGVPKGSSVVAGLQGALPQ